MKIVKRAGIVLLAMLTIGGVAPIAGVDTLPQYGITANAAVSTKNIKFNMDTFKSYKYSGKCTASSSNSKVTVCTSYDNYSKSTWVSIFPGSYNAGTATVTVKRNGTVIEKLNVTTVLVRKYANNVSSLIAKSTMSKPDVTAKLTSAAKSKIDSIKKKCKGVQRLSNIYWVLRNYDLTSSDGIFISDRQLVNMAVYYAGLSGKIPYIPKGNADLPKGLKSYTAFKGTNYPSVGSLLLYKDGSSGVNMLCYVKAVDKSKGTITTYGNIPGPEGRIWVTIDTFKIANKCMYLYESVDGKPRYQIVDNVVYGTPKW